MKIATWIRPILLVTVVAVVEAQQQQQQQLRGSISLDPTDELKEIAPKTATENHAYEIVKPATLPNQRKLQGKPEPAAAQEHNELTAGSSSVMLPNRRDLHSWGDFADHDFFILIRLTVIRITFLVFPTFGAFLAIGKTFPACSRITCIEPCVKSVPMDVVKRDENHPAMIPLLNLMMTLILLLCLAMAVVAIAGMKTIVTASSIVSNSSKMFLDFTPILHSHTTVSPTSVVTTNPMFLLVTFLNNMEPCLNNMEQ